MTKLNPPSSSRQFLTVPEVAKRLRLPFGRVLELVRAHEIQAQLISNCRYFVSVDELARFRRTRGKAA